MTADCEVFLIPGVHKEGAGVAVSAVDSDTVAEIPSVVVIFEEISGAGGEGWAVTLDVTDTVALTLLKEADGKLLVKSNLGVKDWVRAEVTGRLCVTGVVLAIAAGAVVTKLLIDDAVLGVSVCSDASLLAVEGALVSVAGVLGGAVVTEVTAKVVFIVIGGEDMIGEEVFVKGAADGFVSTVVVTFIAISVDDLIVGVVSVEDLVKVVMMLLGFIGEEGTLEEGCVVRLGEAVLGESEVLNEDNGLEKEVYEGDVSTTGVMAPLALPHSASTSAMMSPPEMESKVKSEEMSARSVLRLVSPGTIAACIAACDSLPPGVTVLEGDVAELSWTVRLLLVGSELSVPGLPRERG